MDHSVVGRSGVGWMSFTFACIVVFAFALIYLLCWPLHLFIVLAGCWLLVAGIEPAIDPACHCLAIDLACHCLAIDPACHCFAIDLASHRLSQDGVDSAAAATSLSIP